MGQLRGPSLPTLRRTDNNWQAQQQQGKVANNEVKVQGGLRLTPSLNTTGIPVERPPSSPLVMRSTSNRIGGGTMVPMLLDQRLRIGLHDNLPTEFQLRSWFLLYSSARHGTSYQGMLNTCMTLTQERVKMRLVAVVARSVPVEGNNNNNNTAGTQFPLLVAFLVQDKRKATQVIGVFTFSRPLMSPLSNSTETLPRLCSAHACHVWSSSGLRVYQAQIDQMTIAARYEEYMAFGCGRHANGIDQTDDGAAIYSAQS